MVMFLSDPFEALLSLQEALEGATRANWLESSPSGTGAYPPVNIFRKGDDFVVIAEVPGIQKSDLEIQVHGNAIRIAGSKTLRYDEKASVHRRERLAGRSPSRLTPRK
jgi:HSP20 family protein